MAAGFQWDEENGELKWPDSFSESSVGLEQQKKNFKEFLNDPKQLTSENLNFLLKVEEYKKNPSIELRDQIIKQFVPDNQGTFLFSNDDTTPVNLNSEHIYTIVQAKNSEIIDSKLFDEAAKHIVDMMNSDTLKKFGKSEFNNRPAPESKGFSFGKLLSQVGGLLLSGLKEVGKFLFSSPSSSGGSVPRLNASDFILDTGKAVGQMDANAAFGEKGRWGPKALAAVEALTAARVAFKQDSSNEKKQAVDEAFGALNAIVKKQTNEFLTDFEKAYPLKYQAYEAAKNLLKESVNPAPVQSVQNGSKPPVTPTFNAKKQADSDVRDQSQTRPSQPAIKPPTPGPK